MFVVYQYKDNLSDDMGNSGEKDSNLVKYLMIDVLEQGNMMSDKNISPRNSSKLSIGSSPYLLFKCKFTKTKICLHQTESTIRN